MRQYALIDAGKIANIIEVATTWPVGVDVTDLTPKPGIGWAHLGGMSFSAPEAVAAPEPELPAVVSRRITRLAFRNRFTQAELVGLEIASLDNPAAALAQRQQAAALRVSQTNVTTATFIDLDRADTRAGVLQLEAGGLLAAGRALVILDTPPTPEEIPVGG